jgi:hypothetical protein
MSDKKNVFHYSMTALNTIIAVFALYLAFSHNKQLTDIDFLWETNAALYMPSELTIKQAPSDDSENIKYFLSEWINLKIVNTGFRAFTVDTISVIVSPVEMKSSSGRFIKYVFLTNLTKPQDNGMPTNGKIELPIVIESGHSKKFLKKVQLPISRKIYFEYKQKFKNMKSEPSDENICSLLKNYDIISHVTLAGGQTKSAEVKFCQYDEAISEMKYIIK